MRDAMPSHFILPPLVYVFVLCLLLLCVVFTRLVFVFVLLSVRVCVCFRVCYYSSAGSQSVYSHYTDDPTVILPRFLRGSTVIAAVIPPWSHRDSTVMLP